MNINRLTQFHENPAIIAWWQQHLSKMLAWFIPSRRRFILFIAAIFIGIRNPLREMSKTDELPVPSDWFGLAALLLVLFSVLWMTYRASVNFKSLPVIVRRHPQITLHLMYWGVLIVLWSTTPTAGAWRSVLLGFAVIFPFLVWRCGYLLLAGQHGHVAKTSFYDQLIVLWPAFGGSSTPYGKGLNYLSTLEAKNEEELARSQLAGIKLLILSALWRFASYLMEEYLYGPGTPVPKLSHLVSLGTGAPNTQAWSSIYCELIWHVLHLAAGGHKIIGILRLFGFNVFRNTYKPLLAESIIEFWNRFYYYFKELLVTFFFIPTFTQLGSRLRRWPKLRLFSAVFSAAFFGNMYYHLLRFDTTLAQGNVLDAMYELRSRAFYCFLLAIGIYVSMLLQQKRAGKAQSTHPIARLSRIFWVWTFFSMITIWNVGDGSIAFTTRVEFFFSLFGFM